MRTFRKGETVYVEGVVIEHEPGEPYGAVLIDFPAATDEEFTQDGLSGWHPAALVFAQGVVFPDYTEGIENNKEDARGE